MTRSFFVSNSALDIDDTGVAAKFQIQTFKSARYCVRERREPQDVVIPDTDHSPRIAEVQDDWSIFAYSGDVQGSLPSGVKV